MLGGKGTMHVLKKTMHVRCVLSCALQAVKVLIVMVAVLTVRQLAAWPAPHSGFPVS